jgi:hypothetical protein
VEFAEGEVLHLGLAQLQRADHHHFRGSRFVEGGDAHLGADLNELEEDTAGHGVSGAGHRDQASEKVVMPCASNW